MAFISSMRAGAFLPLLCAASPAACSSTQTGQTTAASATGGSGWTSDATHGGASSSGGGETGTTAGASTAAGTTAGMTGSAGSGSTGDAPKFDLGAVPDTPTDDCLACSITIASQQSGALAVLGTEVFGTASLQGQVVYALGTSGAGRYIASADSSLPFNEVTNCPVVPWLAGTNAPPAIFTFGWGPSDGPKNFSPQGETVGGLHLPAQYVGNPAALAADYDIVVYLEASGQWDQGEAPSDLEMQTLVDYVTIHGGGLYVVSEFFGYMKDADLVSVNRVMKPLGVEALAVNLDWGNAEGNIDFECFPPPAG